MTEVIKQFRESNRKLFEITKSERTPLPHNGEISVMKQRVLRGGETTFRTGFSFKLDGREYFEPTIEDAEKILHNAGFELKRKDYGLTEYVNKERQQKYLAIVSKNEEITNAWRKISENAHKLLFSGEFPKCYVRFGSLPKSGKSRNYMDNRQEEGISVFAAVKIDERYYVNVAGGMFMLFAGMENRPAFLVSGDVLNETGSDGEPLLRNAKVISEIDKNVIFGYNYFIKDVYDGRIS